MDLLCRVCLEEVGANNWVCLFVARYNQQLFSNILKEFAAIEIIQNDHMPDKICNKCSVALVKAYNFRKSIKISDRKLRLKVIAQKINQVDLSLVKVEDNHQHFEGSSGATENSFLANVNECESVDSSIQFGNTNNKNINTDQMFLKQSNELLIDKPLNMLDDRIIGNVPELHKISKNARENSYGNTELRSLSESNDNFEGVFLKNKDLSQINMVQNKFPNNDSLMLPKLVPISNKDVSQINVAQSIMPRNEFPNNDDLLLPKLVPISKNPAPKLEFKSPDNDDYDPLHSTLKINNRTAYRCKDCNKTFIVKRRYIIHLNSHLGIRLYPCNICNKSFSYESGLKIHSYIHTGEKPYECKMCNTRFRTAGALVNHERIHFNEKPYHCERCGKNFRQIGGLKAHIVHVHNQERPYICEVCSMRFKTASTLKNHALTVHCTERNYACSTCEKRFKSIYTLREHQKCHLGIRPHKCEVCHKGFSARSTVKIHMRIHEGVKPFSCKICNKAFRETRTLQLHMRSHSGETPYHCTFCEKKFGYKHHLKSHIKKYHEDPQN